MKNELKNKKELIKFLEFIRDTEASKPVDEIDTDLIDACVYVLLDLQDKNTALSPEQIKEKVRAIPFEDSTVSLEEYKNKKKKTIRTKRVFLIAACIGILIALLVTASTGSEYNILKDIFGRIVDAPFDVWYNQGNDSEIHNNGTVIYKSFDEAEKGEGINILEPGYLPDDSEFADISFYSDEYNKRIGDVRFTNIEIPFTVVKDSCVTEDIKSYTYEENIGSNVCYFVEMEDVNLVQVYFEHDGNLYDITYNSKDELVKIIESLKE